MLQNRCSISACCPHPHHHHHHQQNVRTPIVISPSHCCFSATLSIQLFFCDALWASYNTVVSMQHIPGGTTQGPSRGLFQVPWRSVGHREESGARICPPYFHSPACRKVGAIRESQRSGMLSQFVDLECAAFWQAQPLDPSWTCSYILPVWTTKPLVSFRAGPLARKPTTTPKGSAKRLS